MDLPCADTITKEFDRRVSDGTVVFDPDYKSIIHTNPVFPIEFRILATLTRKPTASTTAPPPTPCRPGSDISTTNNEIGPLSPTHLLAFNLFSSARPHLLILTQDGHRRQTEPLDTSDMAALRRTLTLLSTSNNHQQQRPLAIFNCGVAAGCSRAHKHMQVFSAPDPSVLTLWPDHHVGGGRGPPFRAFVRRFQRLPSAETLERVYRGLLGQAARALGVEEDGERREAAVPHNVILDRRWMVVVPRRTAEVQGASANAAAFLGMVWVPSEDKVRRWCELGVARVLAELSLPAEDGSRDDGGEKRQGVVERERGRGQGV